MPRALLLAATLLATTILSACSGRQPPQPDYDPWQPFNRTMFSFNDAVDTYALEPVARGWDYVMPDAVQRALSNFFNNLRFPIVFPNDLLQGKPRKALEALASFQINTFMGGLGFFDVAGHFGLKRQEEDTGQTFGVWGIAPGPYLVLPFLGPSGVRDGFGLLGDFGLGFYTYFVPVPGATVGAAVINIVNERARLLDDVKRVKEASFDYYIAVRNGYIQRRWKLINDSGAGSTAEEEDNLYNEAIYENYLEQGDTP